MDKCSRDSVAKSIFVISPDLELAGLDARHWRNGWRLLAPPRVLAQPRWALVIMDGGQPIKVVLAGPDPRGTISPPPLAGSLEAYAKQLGVSGLIALERSVIGELSAEIEAALRPGQDGVEQALI